MVGFFGLFYDLLKDGIVGITAIFRYVSLQNKSSGLFFCRFKDIWIKFTVVLFLYSLLLFIVNFSSEVFL